MLVLASTSRYRRELLARLRMPMRVVAPQVDETPRPGERPDTLAARLAIAKAEWVRDHLAGGTAQPQDRLVIGSDQVATLDGVACIGKPGNHEQARQQLAMQSGRRVAFHTAVAIASIGGGPADVATVTTQVSFRTLDDQTIEAYLLAETPYDCAGAAKSEGLGIALLEAIEGPDATALIGLPLIELCRLLRRAGCPPILAQT